MRYLLFIRYWVHVHVHVYILFYFRNKMNGTVYCVVEVSIKYVIHSDVLPRGERLNPIREEGDLQHETLSMLVAQDIQYGSYEW